MNKCQRILHRIIRELWEIDDQLKTLRSLNWETAPLWAIDDVQELALKLTQEACEHLSITNSSICDACGKLITQADMEKIIKMRR